MCKCGFILSNTHTPFFSHARVSKHIWLNLSSLCCGAKEDPLLSKLSSWMICKGKKVFQGNTLEILGADNEPGDLLSQGKEAEKCSICCSSQYQGLRWTLGRGILSSIHAQKKRTEGWKEAGRQQKPLWAPREFAELGMLAVAPWEGPAPPQRLWQKQLPGNGGAQCSGAVPRPGWEVAAGNGWYKLNKLLRSLWRPMEQLYFSCAGGGSDNLQISYFVHIVYIYL